MSNHPESKATVASYRSPHGIEQDRRDFMRDHPDLYAYICNRASAKVLDEAGDAISGHHAAANTVWSMAARYKREWQSKARAQGESRG